MKKLINLLMLLLVFGIYSCSDLEPEFGDVIPEENYFQNEASYISALGSAYTNLYGFMNHGQMFSLDAVSSDEACIPHKGPDWEDGKQWLRMHRHEFFDGEGVFGNVWNFSYGGINTCNRLLATFEAVGTPEADAFIAELRALRAYYYLILMDVFGNVPLVTSFDVEPDFKPATVSRQEIFNFVESELRDNVDKLTKTVGGAAYGRVNYYAGQAMLMSLYLNAGVYTGTPQWQKAIDACDAIINDGKYSLESNFFANFAVNNAGSKENIWNIPYDGVNAGGFNLVQMTLHYESQKTFKTVDQPWNGYCVLADFYASFEQTDERFTGAGRGYGVMLHGPQYDFDGNLLFDNADSWYPDKEADAAEFPSLTEEERQRAVVFGPEINQLEPQAWRDGGARISKYEYGIGTVNSMSNDFALYRYAEVLLNKAEAMWRLNAGSTEALDMVNLIRERAGVAPFASLDADNFLAERGREMCFEAKRRADLIRFGAWGDTWWEKTANEPHKTLMPIPGAQIALNPNLDQNPGY
jgi:starch-binding outer membrane protein, SusD/RagB family